MFSELVGVLVAWYLLNLSSGYVYHSCVQINRCLTRPCGSFSHGNIESGHATPNRKTIFATKLCQAVLSYCTIYKFSLDFFQNQTYNKNEIDANNFNTLNNDLLFTPIKMFFTGFYPFYYQNRNDARRLIKRYETFLGYQQNRKMQKLPSNGSSLFCKSHASSSQHPINAVNWVKLAIRRKNMIL